MGIYCKFDGKFYLVQGLPPSNSEILDIVNNIPKLPAELIDFKNLKSNLKKYIQEYLLWKEAGDKDVPYLEWAGYIDFDTEDGKPVIIGNYLKSDLNSIPLFHI